MNKQFSATSNYNPLGIIARVSGGVERQETLCAVDGVCYTAKKSNRYEGDHVIPTIGRKYPVFGYKLMERSVC